MDSERRQSLRSFIFVNTLYEVINMLTIRKENFRDDEINVILDGLVPENHLVRKIENAIDFSFIYDKVKDLYSPLGAPSIDPVVLIKIVLIQYLFGIPSMRQTIREIEVNVAYRWFLGYSLTEKIPHFSTFNKNYERRFKNTDLFESIFKEILARATKCGFVDSSNIYIDSTHIKASANKKKYTKVEVDIQAKHYQEKLEKEINEDRLKHGKSPLCEVKNEEVKKKEKIESNTDKDSGMFFKNEKEKCFAYLAHTACDNNNFILDFHITSGNIHDSVAFSDLYQKIKNNSKQHTTAIAIDAGYITPYICKTILDDGIIPAIPYKRPMTKKGFFKKYEYVYDEYYDCYICPNNKILKYSTTNRDGYREYKSNPSDCKSCEHLNICTNSKNKQKLVTRHIWQNYLEEADHLRHKPYVKKVYSKRKETIERVFADAKEKHGMRYTKLRGLSKIEMEVSLIFSCMNLKKLANWMWKDTSSNLRLTPIFSILSLKIFIKKKTYIFIQNISYVLGWGEKIKISYLDASNPTDFTKNIVCSFNNLIRLEGVEISSEQYNQVMKLFLYDEPMKTFVFQAYDMNTLVGKGKHKKYKKLTVSVDSCNHDEAKRKLKDSKYWIVWNDYTETLLQT